MPQNNFIPRFCPVCGSPKNKLQDGEEIITRCPCDWQRETHERIKKTVAPIFYTSEDGSPIPYKTIMDWSPPQFKKGGPGIFKNLIKIQKAVALQKMYDFCFKPISTNPKKYSIEKQIDENKVLFIRGPKNSGRGLLIESIKVLAAGVDISVTPLPGTWSAFKSDVSQANWQGKESELIKMEVTEKYRNVKILSLEDLHGEKSLDDKFPTKPFWATGMINEIFSKRMIYPGCITLTSGEFIKQFGDTLGNELTDILLSDKTTIILMFSPAEADMLLTSLRNRINTLRQRIVEPNIDIHIQHSLEKDKQKKTGLQNQLANEKESEEVEELLFLEDSFPKIPTSVTITGETKSEIQSLTEYLKLDTKRWSAKIKQAHANFLVNKNQNNLAYQEGRRRSFISAVKNCPELGNKMSPKEMEETGRLMSLACSSTEEINKITDVDIREKIMNA